jgi:V/A-type H+-transporting ATPase subunit E
MEIQLQELIDKIKKDGIEAASEEAAKLKREAEQEAAKIVAAARKEADDIVSKGKADAERSEKAGKAALEQASRNLVLAFKGEIEVLLEKIVSQSVSSAYGPDTLKAILPELFKAWVSKGSTASLDLLLSVESLEKLKSWAGGALSAELKKGVELKSDRNLGKGFRIANKDGSAYYDFSAESVAELLSAYLNPHLAEILSTSTKGT